MLDNELPNLVEPVTKSMLEVIVCATIVCAVRVPLTVKLSADDAVEENDAVVALAAFVANEADTAFVANEALTAFNT